jgi:hypothetical protein
MECKIKKLRLKEGLELDYMHGIGQGRRSQGNDQNKDYWITKW